MTFTAANFRQLLPDNIANLIGSLTTGHSAEPPTTGM